MRVIHLHDPKLPSSYQDVWHFRHPPSPGRPQTYQFNRRKTRRGTKGSSPASSSENTKKEGTKRFLSMAEEWRLCAESPARPGELPRHGLSCPLLPNRLHPAVAQRQRPNGADSTFANKKHFYCSVSFGSHKSVSPGCMTARNLESCPPPR